MILLEMIFIFFLGAIFGSFALVLVDRGQKGKSLLGFSACDHCGRQLAWFDNIPVFSFLFLRGRCRRCRKKLSLQYPLTEILMGTVFLLLAFEKGLFLQYLSAAKVLEISFFLLVGFLLVCILIWDWKYMIIPDGLVLGGAIVTAGFQLFLYFRSPFHFFSLANEFFSGLVGALIVGGFFYLMYVFSKGRWIGGGDVKLGAWLGLLVGAKMVFLLLLIAYVSGALVALTLLARKKKQLDSQLPFGPFLVLSAFLLLLWGKEIAHWFWG